MTVLKQLEKRLQKIIQNLDQKYPDLDQQKKVLAFIAKLNEELGELSSEILSSFKLQRKVKLSNFQKENIKDEWTDVLVVLLLLGLALEIDVKEAIKDIKVNKPR